MSLLFKGTDKFNLLFMDEIDFHVCNKQIFLLESTCSVHLKPARRFVHLPTPTKTLTPKRIPKPGQAPTKTPMPMSPAARHLQSAPAAHTRGFTPVDVHPVTTVTDEAKMAANVS